MSVGTNLEKSVSVHYDITEGQILKRCVLTKISKNVVKDVVFLTSGKLISQHQVFLSVPAFQLIELYTALA